MAVYCPIYDPIYGWYILVCGPTGTYKQCIVSPLFYYHSLGVKPPVGSKFTQQDYEELQDELIDSSYIPSSFAPIPVPYLPQPISTSSLTAPASAIPSQAAAKSVSGFDDLFEPKDPLLISTVEPAFSYCPIHNPQTLSTASSSKFSDEATVLASVASLSKNLDFVKSVFSLPYQVDQFGSSSPLSLVHPSVTNGANGTPFSIPSIPYLSPMSVSSDSKYNNLSLPSTSSNLSHHLHSLPSTSSGFVSTIPPIDIPYPQVIATAAASSSKVNHSPVSSAIYNNMAYEMHLDEVEGSAYEAEDCEMS